MSVLSGRNIYSHTPVIQMLVDLRNLTGKTTTYFDNFNNTLLALFPRLAHHHCSTGEKGGFVAKLRSGTYFGHVFEHLTLELQALLGYDVFFGKTRVKQSPSIYNVIFEYHNENVAIECAKQSINIIECIIEQRTIELDSILRNLTNLKEHYELGPSSRAIFDEAKKRGIPVRRLGSESILELGYGKYAKRIQATLLDSTSCISVDLASNKDLTKQLLKENNIPVPYGRIAYTANDAVRIADDIGYPVVLKPLDGNQGKGVVLNLTSPEEVKDNFRIPMQYSNSVLVEKHVSGKDYRVLIVGNKVSAVAERIPPQITGNGINTIKELIDIENKCELRGEGHEKPLTKIRLDDVTLKYLERHHLDEYFIPPAGQVVRLRDNGNLSTGGIARECTNEIHPDNIEIAINSAKSIGLDIAGIDIITEDISKPLHECGGVVVEVNAAPGLRMHLYPSIGNKINVASDILDLVYPKDSPYSIPIVAITGTNGKTSTTRLIKHTLELTKKVVGMTTTSGIYIGDKCILKGDNTGALSARTVLSSKQIDAAVLEIARGGIIRRGLGYDLADVGVVTNISDDHIGLDGINTIYDLAFVKALVIESVKSDGYSVLNADDKTVEYFIKRAHGNIILFSKTCTNEILQEHIRNGGIALYIEDNSMYIHHNSHKIRLIDINDIAITFNGTVDCNIENALAATCALYGLSTPLDIIRNGLMSFKPDAKMNPGRFNIFDLGSFRVMLDYGHNIASYEEVGKFVQKLNASSTVGIIGMPGDRSDENIFKVGAKCSEIFSKVYIKEDTKLRGRTPGKVANILYEGLVSANFNPNNIKIILSEIEALQTAISEAQNGELIVLFYEELDPALNVITQLQSQIQNKALNQEIHNIDFNLQFHSQPIASEDIDKMMD